MCCLTLSLIFITSLAVFLITSYYINSCFLCQILSFIINTWTKYKYLANFWPPFNCVWVTFWVIFFSLFFLITLVFGSFSQIYSFVLCQTCISFFWLTFLLYFLCGEMHQKLGRCVCRGIDSRSQMLLSDRQSNEQLRVTNKGIICKHIFPREATIQNFSSVTGTQTNQWHVSAWTADEPALLLLMDFN